MRFVREFVRDTWPVSIAPIFAVALILFIIVIWAGIWPPPTPIWYAIGFTFLFWLVLWVWGYYCSKHAGR